MMCSCHEIVTPWSPLQSIFKLKQLYVIALLSGRGSFYLRKQNCETWYVAYSSLLQPFDGHGSLSRDTIHSGLSALSSFATLGCVSGIMQQLR